MKSTNKQRNIEGTTKWFEKVPEIPEKISPATEQQIIEMKEEGKKCLDSETANYNIKNAKTSNYQWMTTVMKKGTVSDRIASHTVIIQNDPVHNLEALRKLVDMVKVSKNKECVQVMDVLSDLFLEDLLTPNRKLQAFHQKPLSILNNLTSGNAVSRRKILSLWLFEDQLKEIYNTYIDALNTAAHDSVDNNKEKAIAAIFKLLAGHPEQEKKLLSLLVNKLGDPSPKVTSKTMYCLGQLIRTHSNMQGVILNEVEKLIFRPNVSTKAQYYGLCYLSQFYLNHEESEVAKRLINVYFGFFKACVKKGEIDSRMMSALLMGVNRAYPYAKLEEKAIAEHLDTIYKLVHLANFNVSLQALCLLHQVSDFTNNVADRYYSALYRKLLDPKIIATTHQAMLLNLIYKSLMKDTEINRVKAIVKRLLQLCLHLNTSFTCGILYLISQLVNKKTGLLSVIQKQTISDIDDNDSDGDEKYSDVKTDLDIEVKEEDISDDEKEGTSAAKKHDTSDVDLNASIEIVDVKDPEIKAEVDQGNSKMAPGWHHLNMNAKNEKKKLNEYDALARNPLFAGAEYSAFFELNYLRQHFHPTVSLYATNILNGELIKYQGDPLKDFMLIRFLDRFVFKNPKKADEFHTGSHPTFGKRKMYQAKGVKSLAVTSSEYLRTNADNIPVDEKFLYMYIQKKYSNKSFDVDEDSDVDSVASDEFEEMLEKMAGTKDTDDIDFMEDIGDRLKNKKNKSKNEGDDDDVSEDGDEDFSDEGEQDLMEGDEDDEDLMEEGDEDLLGDLEDDEEEIIFSDEDEEDTKRKGSKKDVKGSKKAKKGIESLFASAEEFAELLEDEGNAYGKPGSSNTLSNKDKSHKKQIMWEVNRNNDWKKRNTEWTRGKKRKIQKSNVNNKNKKFKK